MYELENDDEIEIDLRELFLALKKKIYAFFKVTSPEEIEMCGHGKSYFLVENSNLINLLNSDGSQNVIKEEFVKLF